MNDEGTLAGVINEWEAGEGICIAREGAVYGPYTLQEVHRYLASGEIVPGDFAWREGSLLEWSRLRDLMVEMGVGLDRPPEPPRSVYSDVSVGKFALLSLFTLGFYPLVWFYRNWQFVRERDESRVVPLLRSILGAIFVFPLARDIGRTAGRVRSGSVILIGVGYIGLNACMWFSPPWDLLSFLSFIPLLFLVRQINRINRAAGVVPGRNYARIGPASVAALIVGVPVVLFALVGSFGSGQKVNRVVSSSELTGPQSDFLRAAKIVEPGEQVLFLSSNGSDAIERYGSLLSDRRVTAYSQQGGRLVVDSARLDDVMLLEVKPAPGGAAGTEVLVHTKAANVFRLQLAATGGADRVFIEALKARIGDVEVDPVTAQKARAALDEINDVLKASARPKASAAARPVVPPAPGSTS